MADTDLAVAVQGWFGVCNDLWPLLYKIESPMHRRMNPTIQQLYAALKQKTAPLAIAAEQHGISSQPLHNLTGFPDAATDQIWHEAWAVVKRLEAIAKVPSVQSSNDSDTRTQIQKAWDKNPLAVFDTFRDAAVTLIELVARVHFEAKQADDDQPLADVFMPYSEDFMPYLRTAKEIWWDTPIGNCLTGVERIMADTNGVRRSRYDGSCYHEVAINFADGLVSSSDSPMTCREYAAHLRFTTATGDSVTDYLKSLAADIRCEWRAGMDSWRERESLATIQQAAESPKAENRKHPPKPIPTTIWSVEDYYTAKKFYEDNGAVFNPALQKGSPAAYHVIAQAQLKASQQLETPVSDKPAQPTEVKEHRSAPMTKAEMARRITGKRKARARELESFFATHGIKSVGGNKWTICLDLMDENTRRKLETPST